MENLAKSEIAKTFEERRVQFTPYGFTCEIWTPKIMGKFDRHNEVEINFVPSGTLTYLIHDRTISIPGGRVAMFWGLYPHRIINVEDIDYYYVITVPLGIFLKWHLSSAFIDKVMKGEVIVDREPYELDSILFRQWHDDCERNKDLEDIVRSEVHCRVRRLEKSGSNPATMPISSYESNMYDHIERMAMFISANYDKNMSVIKVADHVGLHPDYASSIFKRVFGHTISEHIAIERIAKAQRRLLFSSDSISAIAYEVGYESLSSFNRAFKKLTGIPPRAYRTQINTSR